MWFPWRVGRAQNMNARYAGLSKVKLSHAWGVVLTLWRAFQRCAAALSFATITAVILRCSPFFRASLEGWPRAPVFAAILRDAAQGRGSSG